MRSDKNRSENTITGAKPRRRNDYIRLADGIFSSSVFIIIFALFCSARVGYFLLIALLVTPGVSILWAFISSKVLSVSISEDESEMLLNKKDTDFVGYRIYNPLILPSALVRIRVECSPNMSRQKEIDLAAVMGHRETKGGIVIEAVNAGGAKARLGDIYVEDFFGIVRFPIRSKGNGLTKRYGITPQIPEISSKDPILEEANQHQQVSP